MQKWFRKLFSRTMFGSNSVAVSHLPLQKVKSGFSTQLTWASVFASGDLISIGEQKELGNWVPGCHKWTELGGLMKWLKAGLLCCVQLHKPLGKEAGALSSNPLFR